jgi:hypothetical protein
MRCGNHRLINERMQIEQTAAEATLFILGQTSSIENSDVLAHFASCDSP